jgi:hypothetical protein
MFYNNNLIKNLQFCFGLFLIAVLVLSTMNVANAANSLSCPEELPICNATTLANYNTPIIDDEANQEPVSQPAYSIGIQSVTLTDAQLDAKVAQSTDLGAGDEIAPQASLPSNTSKSLDVPYINQYKDQNGDVWGTRYHCGAAAASIVAGYFKKFPYKGSDDDQYRKYMNSNSGQGVTETCNGQGGAFGITGYPDRSSSAYCKASYPDGVSKYLKKIGLKYKIVAGTGAGLGMISIGTVKAAINRGNPIVISSGAHYYVIKGYTTDNKIIVNDSWKDASKTSASVYEWGKGKNAVYDLKNLYPYQNSSYQDVRFAWEVSTSNTSFYNGSNVEDVSAEPKAEPKKVAVKTPTKTPITKSEPISTQNGSQVVAYGASDDSEGLNVRASAGGEIIDMVTWGTKGVITDGPKTAMGISWNKVKWENGLEGWSAKKYLAKSTSKTVSTESVSTNAEDLANVKIEKPTTDSVFTNIKLASDETKCIDLRSSTIAQNNPLQVWNCNDSIAQNWVMPNAETNPDGYGQIKFNTSPNYCLDFNGPFATPTEGRTIKLALCDNEDKSASEWMINDLGQIKPSYDDTLCIGLTSNKSTKGNTFELQTCNDSVNQKFVM